MADYGGAAQDIFGGIGSIFASSGYSQEAGLYKKAAGLEKLSTGIKEVAVGRQIYQTIGAGKAVASASGLKLSGSAADVMRSSAAQGSIERNLIGIQGQINVEGLMAQADAAQGQADASLAGGIGGILGGLFSDRRLKEDIVFLYRRPDGLGIYRFRYKDGATHYEGVMADEVATLYPDAVSEREGYKTVDYQMIGFDMRVATHA